MEDVCSGCNQPILKETCWCGEDKMNHSMFDNHVFIPMGCDCFRDNKDLQNVD